MTAIRITHVVCDDCGHDFRHVGTPAPARREAKKKGWVRWGKGRGFVRDRCPSCAARLGSPWPTDKPEPTPWTKAFAEIEAGASIRGTARKHNLPVTTLWSRVQGRKYGG